MSEALIRLSSQSDATDLRKVGQITITKPKYISGPLMASYCRTTAAQAIIDNIQTTLGSLLLRNAIPRLDFLDGYKQKITDQTWIQPQNKVKYDQSNHQRYAIYHTNHESRNDRKVIFIYGILNMKPDQPIHATNMYFTTNDVKVHQTVDLTTLPHYHNIVFLQIPMMYRRGDNAAIHVDIGPDARDHNDHLALLAIVAESMGSPV